MVFHKSPKALGKVVGGTGKARDILAIFLTL